jgi:hypothetical protein
VLLTVDLTLDTKGDAGSALSLLNSNPGTGSFRKVRKSFPKLVRCVYVTTEPLSKSAVAVASAGYHTDSGTTSPPTCRSAQNADHRLHH